MKPTTKPSQWISFTGLIHLITSLVSTRNRNFSIHIYRKVNCTVHPCHKKRLKKGRNEGMLHTVLAFIFSYLAMFHKKFYSSFVHLYAFRLFGLLFTYVKLDMTCFLRKCRWMKATRFSNWFHIAWHQVLLFFTQKRANSYPNQGEEKSQKHWPYDKVPQFGRISWCIHGLFRIDQGISFRKQIALAQLESCFSSNFAPPVSWKTCLMQ